MQLKKFAILFVIAALLISCFNFVSVFAAPAYVVPYVTNVKIRPYHGVDINSNSVISNGVSSENFMISWDSHGSLSWTELVISETPFTYTDGSPISYATQSFNASNPTHMAHFQHLYDNYFKLDRNSNAYNVAGQDSLFVNQDTNFYRDTDRNSNTPHDRIYPLKNPVEARGKTFYLALLICGKDENTGIFHWYIGATLEYTIANTMAVIPNGLSNTIKYALVQNTDTSYFHENEGLIIRWDSYDDYLANIPSKAWYVRYEAGRGYAAYNRNVSTGAVDFSSPIPSSQSYASYGTFVDDEVTADYGTIHQYYYQIYESNLASYYPLYDYDTTSSVVPGPIVAIDNSNSMYITDKYGQSVLNGIDFAIWAAGADGSGFEGHELYNPTMHSYRTHYRWTVINIYTSYLNTCKNQTEPTYDSAGNMIGDLVLHNGAGECGSYYHSNPTITKGGRLGYPNMGITDAKGRVVTDKNGGLEPEYRAPEGVVCYDKQGNPYYDPCNVAFSFSNDWREEPLYLDKGVFPDDPDGTNMNLVTGTDLMRGCTYLFVFTSCYTYELGETPPGWDHAVNETDIANRTNQIFGNTHIYYTVPYVSTSYDVYNPNDPSQPINKVYSSYGNIPHTNTTPIDVTVTWTDFEYKLVETWNPNTHKYEYAFGAANAGSGKVTVKNNGLADITTHIECDITPYTIPNSSQTMADYVYGYWYDPLVPSDQRQWLNTKFKPDGVHIAPSATQNFHLFIYASRQKDNYPYEFQPAQRDVIKNNTVIGSVTISINEKYKFIT